MPQLHLAHVKNDPANGWAEHELGEHLKSVAELAGKFAQSFSSSTWAHLAGLWHDLGKYQPAFQDYIRSASGMDAHIETAPGRVKHAIAGAAQAVHVLGPRGRLLAYLIAGHHAGLPDWYPDDAPGAALSQEIEEGKSIRENAMVGGVHAEVLNPDLKLTEPPIRESGELHFWLRMLFSCLVDADFLDTERFMDEHRALDRDGYADIETLRGEYDRFMAANFSLTDSSVNRLRAEILASCLAHAGDDPGLFSLSVPTGGGKTLASLGFALHHAARHGLKRIIYVIPYTSIIEQTADVFRRVFAGCTLSPVVEHHSNLETDNETPKSRLSAENWDAPIVVTTNVQFFESLYSAKPSRCRKLHNLVESVVILDEAQLLPPEHLQPILDGLRQLLKRYRVSLVLSTATQPELTKTRVRFGEKPLTGLGEASELAPNPERLSRELDRVTVSLPASPLERRDWDDVARELAGYDRVLCIVNRRDDAETLWRKLPPGAIHLSARMCGAHRASVIARIKAELGAGHAVRVVSTQLVEAGVDLDFPVVYRAMAGLDSIAQAAGRCNREGRLGVKGGRVVVFNPPKPSPSGLLLKAEQAAQAVLAGSSGEPLTPANYARYFDRFYADVNGHDKADMADLLVKGAYKGEIQFRTAAMRFRLIPDEGQRSVFVRWGGGTVLIERLKSEGPHRKLMRRLQRHAVTLHDRQWKKLLASGELELHDEFLIQRTETLYHPELGLLPEVPDYDPKSLMA